MFIRLCDVGETLLCVILCVIRFGIKSLLSLPVLCAKNPTRASPCLALIPSYPFPGLFSLSHTQKHSETYTDAQTDKADGQKGKFTDRYADIDRQTNKKSLQRRRKVCMNVRLSPKYSLRHFQNSCTKVMLIIRDAYCSSSQTWRCWVQKNRLC